MTIKQTIGIVLSNSMHKTITVGVMQKVPHRKYSKIISRTNKYYVHDEENECKIGDVVKIRATKPISKNKRWLFVNKISKN